MRYMRCQCGAREALTSMSIADCDGCPECKTTLAEGPSGHRPIAEHEFVEEYRIDKYRGRTWRAEVCRNCGHEQQVEGSERDISPNAPGVDEKPAAEKPTAEKLVEGKATE